MKTKKREAGEKKQRALAWVVSVDMGLGHQRAANPLRSFGREGIVTVGEQSTGDPRERRLWQRLRSSYEFLSRVKSLPVLGTPLFAVLDTLQNIPPFYPLRDLSKQTFQVKLVTSLLRKGLCGDLLQKLREDPLPLLTTYFAPALAADRVGHGRVYCVITDTDMNRVWVAENPKTSKIHYLAPCGHAVMRLRAYGVPEERIFLTGFPLPREVLGDENLEVLKEDLGQRLRLLDPSQRFWPMHGLGVVHFLGKKNTKPRSKRPLTLTFAVGGAGAQKELGAAILKSLKNPLRDRRISLRLVAGLRPEVRDYFLEAKQELFPADDPAVRIVHGETRETYFSRFAETIRETDILWTKPSELVFYCGLGIPIIMAPSIGSQEDFNRKWLLEIQAGIAQEDPAYTNEWLFDLLREGRLAESAWDGFLKARKFGTFKIQEILETGTMRRETSPLKR